VTLGILSSEMFCTPLAGFLRYAQENIIFIDLLR
jgi:hypothetical protein